MGWFAIACALGFLAFWARPIFSDWLVRTYRQTPANADILTVALGLAFLLCLLVLWAIVFEDARRVREVTDAIGHGVTARFLLGLLLGIGAAYMMADRARRRAGGENAPPPPPVVPSPAANAAAAGEANDVGGFEAKFILPTGLAIVLVALAAPHLDRWLSRVSAVKSPLIELQVTTATAHKVAVSEGLESYYDAQSLRALSRYAERLEQDIAYFDGYGGSGATPSAAISSARKLLPAFTTIVSPVAACVQSAIANGLSLDSARQMLLPTAKILEQIVFSEKILKAAGRLDAAHDDFWRELLKLPSAMATYTDDPACRGIPTIYFADGVYYADGVPKGSEDLFPRIQEYENVTYLRVAAAYFISFMADEDKAIRILEDAKPEFKDYAYLWTLARLRYFQGRPGDLATSYFGPLHEMLTTVRDHIRTLGVAKRQCRKPKDLLCREQAAEILVLYNLATFIAEDLARGIEYAAPYTTRLQEYAAQIKGFVDLIEATDKRVVRANPYYSYIEDSKYSLLDSYAYATLVLEARKTNPDIEMLRRKVVAELKRVVSGLEDEIRRQERVDKTDVTDLKIARAHLASALEIAGE
jgi:hypothetical protein